MIHRLPLSILFPYTTLFRSDVSIQGEVLVDGENLYAPNSNVFDIRKKMGLLSQKPFPLPLSIYENVAYGLRIHGTNKKNELDRSEEHTSELQSHSDLVCRLL